MNRPAIARFWAKVDKNGPVPADKPELGRCWVWTLSVQRKRGGYGQFRLGKRTLRAHIVAYELLVGPVPEGLVLDHLCSNPRCVNPAHLEPVTHAENTRRGMSPAAVAVRLNRCAKGHEFTTANTISRRGRRECRTCENARQRRGYAKGRAA